MITVVLTAEVKPTENVENVKHAFLNISPNVQFSLTEGFSGIMILQGNAQGPDAIAVLARKFREQRILEAVRQVLLKSIKNEMIVFDLHRQAALMDRFHLSDLNDVSAMGPIRVEIRANNLHDVIDYIAPPTIKGKPQVRKNLKLE